MSNVRIQDAESLAQKLQDFAKDLNPREKEALERMIKTIESHAVKVDARSLITSVPDAPEILQKVMTISAQMRSGEDVGLITPATPSTITTPLTSLPQITCTSTDDNDELRRHTRVIIR